MTGSRSSSRLCDDDEEDPALLPHSILGDEEFLIEENKSCIGQHKVIALGYTSVVTNQKNFLPVEKVSYTHLN